MIVVSDTSPIRCLHHLNLLSLLEALYGVVILPPAVAHELEHPPERFQSIDITPFPFLCVQTPADPARFQRGPDSLDPGEAEALALAIELSAELILMDEKQGRRVADQIGVRTIGVAGVLLEAKTRQLVPFVGPLLDRLTTDIGFFLQPDFVKRVRKLAGEQ